MHNKRDLVLHSEGFDCLHQLNIAKWLKVQTYIYVSLNGLWKIRMKFQI